MYCSFKQPTPTTHNPFPLELLVCLRRRELKQVFLYHNEGRNKIPTELLSHKNNPHVQLMNRNLSKNR
jgi:hypothetical protein